MDALIAQVPVFVWLLFTYSYNIWTMYQTYTVASDLTVTGSDFMRIFRLIIIIIINNESN